MVCGGVAGGGLVVCWLDCGGEGDVNNTGVRRKSTRAIRIGKLCRPCLMCDNLITPKTKADIAHSNEMVEDGA